MRLLDVQELDSQLDALRHQRATIPEATQVADLAAQRDKVRDAVRDLKVLVDDLTTEQKKADADVESVKARRARNQQVLDSGSASAKDMENLMHEVGSLERRISDLEDVEIEVMERLEEAQNDLQARTTDLDEIQERGRALVATRNEKAKAIDTRVSEVEAEREQTATDIPQDLMDLYAKLRAQKGGVGAAALRARQCGGCMLTLDATILKEITGKADDEVVRCEECGRILVRTAESGLAGLGL
ncbi:MAG: hypothetical protein EOO74_04475 [Myxococcales bacterium]|nr:MAG: hypothetical protein EOO74_04475 [Myxococcales bacterium]